MTALSTPNYVNLISEDITAVENLLHEQANGFNQEIQAAFSLLLAAGGKRMRPTLTLLSGRMLGAPTDKLIKLAASIELLHSATLVHDDLIDGSLLRRGMPTLNSRWSAGATVLTGDFVFARAAHMAACTESIPVMKLFSQTLSTIVEGEINQLFSNRCKSDREGYLKRIYAKTASLFETATASTGLISPDITAEVQEHIRSLGYHLGIIFQIVDDILDFTGDSLALGKPVGSDFRTGIVTLPAIIYAEQYPDTILAKAIAEGRCVQEADAIELAIETIRNSNAIELSYQEAQQYLDIAFEDLTYLPDSPEKDGLIELVNYFIRRNK